MTPFALRPARALDRPFLETLFARSRPEFDLLPEPMRGPLVESQFVARERSYASGYPGSIDQIVEVEGRPIGRLLLHDARSGADAVRTLVDVALLPEMRGRGIGSALLRRVIDGAPSRAVVLHVARDNPAARLYHRFGFLEVGGDAVYAAMSRPADG